MVFIALLCWQYQKLRWLAALIPHPTGSRWELQSYSSITGWPTESMAACYVCAPDGGDGQVHGQLAALELEVGQTDERVVQILLQGVSPPVALLRPVKLHVRSIS